MQKKNKNMIKVLLVLLILVLAGVIYSCAAGKKSPGKEQLKETAAGEASEGKEEAQTLPEGSSDQEPESLREPEQICVHVCGSVAVPGVYYLSPGARVFEAVEQAGGLLDEADSGYVNLAKEAEDGTQIYIPSKQEVEEGRVPAEENAREEASDSRVNINNATVEELKTLPGIGDVKANAIISYREAEGGFSTAEDIMNVAGIKKNSYEQIKDLIKV